MRWLATLVDALARWLPRVWLPLYLGFLGLYAGLPIAAPLLAANGHESLSRPIYLAYRATCHQLPHHSWFLGGREPHYDWPTLQPHTPYPPERGATAFHRPIRHSELGYQLAFCQRDAAIWWSLLLASLGLALARRRGMKVPALSLPVYLLAALPMAIDGLSQLAGLRESSPLLRSLTGALFGLATAALVLPILDDGFRELAESAEEGSSPRR